MIRVYRRKPGDRRGFSDSRPWNVAGIPEDPRETCYPTWADAMAWATATTEERSKVIDEELTLEGGW